jgi:hypothetical protein
MEVLQEEMKAELPDDEERANAKDLACRCWLGPILLAFWALVIVAVFYGCTANGGQCKLAWTPQEDAVEYRIYCGIDLLTATADSQATVTLPDGPCALAFVAVDTAGNTSTPTSFKISFVTYQDSLDMRAWRNAPGRYVEFIHGKRFHRTKLETP